ncbi:MAG TPA: helix-turn-helix domain-containing protein [Chitinophaga sp.]|nr:helix-turn-helix domain-containing protein [Chitinophaga sp.]
MQFIPGQIPVFNALRYDSTGAPLQLSYNRRDYYKVWVVKYESRIHYANRSIHITQPALIFSNPLVPYSFEAVTQERSGYMCIFTEEFLRMNDRVESLQESPFFRIGADPVFFLDNAQLAMVSQLYDKMIEELASGYIYKLDVIRNYLNLLIHEAMKMQPAITFVRHNNATARIAGLFIELLERQFPIGTPGHVLQLRRAGDYANSLSVHVNHLNFAVKEVTGRSTSTHITERIVNEAKALLRHTDWSVADIGYSLGFEYPNHFNNFFKKNVGVTPLSLRK